MLDTTILRDAHEMLRVIRILTSRVSVGVLHQLVKGVLHVAMVVRGVPVLGCDHSDACR